MNIRDKLFVVSSLLLARLAKKKTPLIVGWAITTRCNKSCAYCDIRNIKAKELDTEHVLALAAELSRLGTKIIHFTGGEPLLREDIGTIIDYCSKMGMSTSINSNGSLVEQRIKELGNLHLMGLSLDGPEEVHDSIRGKGSYKEVITALTLLKQQGIRLRLLAVLSKSNLQCIDFLLEKAEEFDAPILFQPSTALLLGGNQPNPLSLDDAEYKKAIDCLIAKKRKTAYIAHSLSGLRFLRNWPHIKKIRCYARLVSTRIESNASVDMCFRNQFSIRGNDTGHVPFQERFYSAPFISCDRCCCASSVELNCLLSPKVDTVLNAWHLGSSFFSAEKASRR